MSPYYTTLGCAWTHYLVHTDPTLCGSLTDSGCMYASYFTSVVTPEVKAEQSSDLRAERSLEMGVEWSFDSKSRAGWSSDLGVGWNLEQQKCEMGCPLTVSYTLRSELPEYSSGGLIFSLVHAMTESLGSSSQLSSNVLCTMRIIGS